MIDFTAGVLGDPAVQFDDLIEKLMGQDRFMPEDLDEMLLHVVRMRKALAPFMLFAKVVLPHAELPLVIDETQLLTITPEHLRAAAVAYDQRKWHS